MIEAGTVKKHLDGGAVEVEFEHLGTTVECAVLVPVSGDNNIFCLPPIETQVVCSLDDNNNICLGAVYSQQEPVPEEAAKEGYYMQFGKAVFFITENKVVLKNDKTDIKTLFNDLLNIIKNLTVATSMGPSGTPLPPTIQAVEKLSQDIAKLLK
ncbi:MAG: hypothetical protein RR555_11005 [Bacteroidales bacterium]